MFPQSSVAVHVLVIISPAQLDPVTASSNVIVAAIHSSDTVGSLNTGVSGQTYVPSGQIPLITGAVPSSWKLLLGLLPFFGEKGNPCTECIRDILGTF
mgnify:CR=1 FL=1